MRLIDADDHLTQIAKRLEYIEQRRKHLAKHLHFFMMDGAIAGELRRTIETIKNAHTIDAVPVVRCKDCNESEKCTVAGIDCLYCGVWDTIVHCNGYCNHGAKIDGGEEE